MRACKITLLGEAERELEGSLLNLCGTAAVLLLAEPVAAGASLKLEFENRLLLGEVSYSGPANGGQAVGVRLEQSLVPSDELARLARQLCAGPACSGDPAETLIDRGEENRQQQ